MRENYQQFVERMISRYEGGYGWDKADSGGPTKYGITCYDLAAHRHQVMDSMARWAPIVRAMPLSEADEIYASKYATACGFDDLVSGADCVVFDFGVNSGPGRAVAFAQHIVGATADGRMGPATKHAINSHDTATFINALCDARLAFLKRLSIWGTFGRGWTARIADLRKYSLALVHDHAKLALIDGAGAKSYDA
jgi:lysozyme family protein